MNRSVRLTVGQALVRFVAGQYVERDGRENRFIEGFWGIFGHGNVGGLGQGIVEVAAQEGFRFYRPQNEQGMVHIATAFAKHRNRLATFACTTSIGPGATNMITGAATATVNRLPVLLLPSDYFANRIPVGDGSYLMMNSEIVTAVAEGLKLTIVVLDNHGYQCILGLQRIVGVSDFGNELRYRDPKSGSLTGDYVPVDFKKHAESMGAYAVSAQTAAEVTAAVQEARRRPGVSVQP
jgi:TPP-dependent trihydroxycyclohexane-1,2-dione (THcHDO) dehydratase